MGTAQREKSVSFNLKLYIKSIWFSFFKSHHTPGRLTPKRFLILLFIFLVYPFWHLVIRLSYGLDQVFYPDLINQNITQPIFIIGNFRSGTTLLHRLLAKDQRFTGMKTWEIYLAPSIVQRKCLHGLMKINHRIGNPIKTLIDRFEKALQAYSFMHKTGLNEIEEDSHVMLQIWSTYDLFAFFPFPELIKNYIYYDEQVPQKQQKKDMDYYYEVLQRHIYTNSGKHYISKSPSHSAKVKTLHNRFPDAKFINLVRSPLRVIPSSVSMFSNHWKTYGEPDQDFPKSGQEVIQEQAKQWYIYPHQYLKTLPTNQYVMVRYQDLVADPQATVENIYRRFGIHMTAQYQETLVQESEIAKRFKSKHAYSLHKMGLDGNKLSEEFRSVIREYHLEKEAPS